MQRTSLKRAAAVLTALGLCAMGSVAFAPSASAAQIAATVTAASKPVILNAANQSAGNLTVTLGAAAAADSTIDIRISPSSGDCITAEEAGTAISFVSATETAANVSVVPADECPGGAVNNVIRLDFDGVVANGTAIELTNIKYNVSATAPAGDVTLKVNGDVVDLTDSNATLAVVDRLFGDTRFHTAGAIAKEQAADKCANDVVVVNGTNFPDALAAAFLGKPILLVNTNDIPQATKDALSAMGTKNVTIVGGTGVVSSDVFVALEQLDEGTCNGAVGVGKIDATRIQGGNRYATAAAVIGTGPAGTFDANASGCNDEVKTMIVVSGQNFPDALAAGALASSDGDRVCGEGRIPLMLTETNLTNGDLRSEVKEAIAAVDPVSILVIGGTAAVSDAVKDKLDEQAGVTSVTRIFGATRQVTALEVAERLADPVLGGFTGRILVASGANFPDALVAGPLAGGGPINGINEGSPIILTESTTTLGAGALDFIEDTVIYNRATLLGGTGALSDTVKTAVGAAFLDRN